MAVATALPGASVARVEVGDGASVPFDAVLPPLMNVSAESLSHVTRRLAVINVQPGSGTLQAAHDAASDGDELVLADGTYTSSGGNVLEISKSITIRALSPRGAILDGQNARRVVRITSGTVVLEGLDITGGRTTVRAARTRFNGRGQPHFVCCNGCSECVCWSRQPAFLHVCYPTPR